MRSIVPLLIGDLSGNQEKKRVVSKKGSWFRTPRNWLRQTAGVVL
jgi:hypothetical protein